ncbi:DNA protection during starvation protein [Paraliobacillus quinghaiensis]|uniref:DNA protection during starvation protein n=1 Tax=Paraliobacillus quinghaiensis TaxID=470815 RepID=A0A917TE66_9BACI|nr:DNA starvation/stationary phase protection protein [Paraliobacillus quinghaiensis]GGM19403.1 DNA protection during starvation protein [Paraliobacillus quinghaiensis]
MTNENQALQQQLNQLVATHGVFFTKLHQHHWYVKGHNFFVLHEKFEELYNEVNEKFDEFAERLLTIGGSPYSTLKEFLENATIDEKPYSKEVSAEEMVKSVINDYKIIQKELAKGIQLAGEAGDDISEDLMIGYKTSVDKTLWMLTAYVR